MDEGEKAEAQRFQQFAQALKENLSDVKAFLAGGAEKDVYIVCRSESGWAGLRAKAVET
jgi:hypothetical protein